MTVGLSHGLFAGLPDFIEFGRDICGDLREAERREWWLSSGTGGYAGGTIAGSLTRRYHGLLVAPPDQSLNPPPGRRLVVAKADAALIEDGRERPTERERGLPDRDSHLCIGEAVLNLKPGEWAGLVLSLHDDASPDLEAAMERSHAHDKEIIRLAEDNAPEMRQAPDWVRQLLLAAGSFLFARPVPEKGESVIAGYPWFGDWGRDTMIALPGLTRLAARHYAKKQKYPNAPKGRPACRSSLETLPKGPALASAR